MIVLIDGELTTVTVTASGGYVRSKGSFTLSDYITVTVTLTGGTFDLAKQIKGATRQHYGDCNVIAWCEQTLNANDVIV